MSAETKFNPATLGAKKEETPAQKLQRLLGYPTDTEKIYEQTVAFNKGLSVNLDDARTRYEECNKMMSDTLDKMKAIISKAKTPGKPVGEQLEQADLDQLGVLKQQGLYWEAQAEIENRRIELCYALIEIHEGIQFYISAKRAFEGSGKEGSFTAYLETIANPEMKQRLRMLSAVINAKNISEKIPIKE